jgi:hypothetical protein
VVAAVSDDDTVERFEAALKRLRVDDEGCAPSEWADVRACAGRCRDMWIFLGQHPDERLSSLVDATESVLTTFVVIAPSNADIVKLWRAVYDEWNCQTDGLG